MIGLSNQQKVETLISVQDELTIAGLHKGIETSESEIKSRELRVVLEGMKARDRRRAGRKR